MFRHIYIVTFTFTIGLAAAILFAQDNAEQSSDEGYKTLKNAGMSKREYLENIDDYLVKSLPSEIKKLESKIAQMQKQIDILQVNLDEFKNNKGKAPGDAVVVSDPQWEKLKSFDPAEFENLRKDFDALVNDRVGAMELKMTSLAQSMKSIETVLNNVSGMQMVGGSGGTFAPTSATPLAGSGVGNVSGSGSGSGTGSGSGGP